MLLLELTKNELDQVNKSQYIYLKSFQTHLQGTMYHFEHASHDTYQDFLFQTLSILFEHVHSLHQ